jgi:hypothetical protein
MVRFDSFLSGGFTNMAVINSPKGKQSKRTSVDWFGHQTKSQRRLAYYWQVISMFPDQVELILQVV